MPSTGWNVFVASGVAVVVYLGLRMGEVLPALVAGSLLFIGGWMTGYAIEEGAPISIPRMLVAGGICGFVIVWTLLIEQGDYAVGAVVIALVSFAAWFTSELGPIKGDGGPTSPIDEPKPPEGPRPGTPVELGGDDAPDERPSGNEGRERKSVLGRFASVVTPSEPAPPGPDAPGASGPDADEMTDHGGGDASYTTRRVDRDASAERESIFGLGIFYEGDPSGPSSVGATTEESSTTEPKDGDHTRPGAAEPRPEGGVDAGEAEEADETGDADETDEPVEVEIDPADESDDGQSRPPTAEPGEAKPTGRLREPADSPLRPGKAPATETGSADERGDAVAVDLKTAGTAGSDAEADNTEADDTETSAASDSAGDETEEATDDEPPEDHRVDVDDGGGFMFG